MDINKITSKFNILKSKYLLLLFLILPYLSEYFEDGHFPEEWRAWITEFIMTIVILIVLRIIYIQYALLEKQSLVDHLTGIGNRRKFELDINREISRTKRIHTGLVLIFFDLDGFKQINDIYGHEAGDKVLIQFARVLSVFARKGSDFCYRLGGDEFTVIFTDIKSDEINIIEKTIEERLSEVLSSKLPRGVSASKGIVILKENESYDELLKRADNAMYQAKCNKQK